MNREVFCDDALMWLKNHKVPVTSSFVASLPDISEFPLYSLKEWQSWFTSTAALIMSSCPEEGVSIFFQSDIKYQGIWIDKGYLCQKAAEEIGQNLLWHKIICRAPAGVATFSRPSYSHILCFSKKLKLDVSKATPDVIPDLGEKTWQRGMGLEASLLIAKFIKNQTASQYVINPFCGEGSMLAAANALGLHSVGIEKSRKRAMKAEKLIVSENLKSWK